MLCILKQHSIYSYGIGSKGRGLAIAYSFYKVFIYKRILKCHTQSLGCQINVRGSNKFQRLKSIRKRQWTFSSKNNNNNNDNGKVEIGESKAAPPLSATSVYLSDTDSAAIFVSKREKQKRFVSFRVFF